MWSPNVRYVSCDKPLAMTVDAPFRMSRLAYGILGRTALYEGRAYQVVWADSEALDHPIEKGDPINIGLRPI